MPSPGGGGGARGAGREARGRGRGAGGGGRTSQNLAPIWLPHWPPSEGSRRRGREGAVSVPGMSQSCGGRPRRALGAGRGARGQVRRSRMCTISRMPGDGGVARRLGLRVRVATTERAGCTPTLLLPTTGLDLGDGDRRAPPGRRRDRDRGGGGAPGPVEKLSPRPGLPVPDDRVAAPGRAGGRGRPAWTEGVGGKTTSPLVKAVRASVRSTGKKATHEQTLRPDHLVGQAGLAGGAETPPLVTRALPAETGG